MAIVVERTFRIKRGTYPEFERLSREHIWPYMEARGCKILGLFQQIHGGRNDEIILLTAYDSLTHWEATRRDVPPPADASPEVVAMAAASADAIRERAALTETSWTRVLQLATDWVDLGVAPK